MANLTIIGVNSFLSPRFRLTGEIDLGLKIVDIEKSRSPAFSEVLIEFLNDTDN